MFASASKTASATAANYIEDVFSTYLYTGNGTTQTITNGIDLSTKGGLVWCKNRAANTFGSEAHEWYDTVRGAGSAIFSDNTSGQQNYGSSRGVTAFSTTGFTVTNSSSLIGPNANGITEVGWTFREQPKFFDVVTYTGNGGSNRAISHSLGSVPGCYIIKATSTTSNWYVYHRGADGASGGYINQSGILNSTAAFAGSASDGLLPSSTAIYVVDSGSTTTSTNSNGVTYVAYLFAHDAGGFGLTGSDNVITCGSFTTTSNSATVNLGWEPQWLLIKGATTVPGWGAGDWAIFDNMRGISTVIDGSTPSARLMANTTGAEVASTDYQAAYANPTSTGFQFKWSVAGTGTQFIYIAIRRGPMKTPTSGTSVFAPDIGSSSGTSTFDSGFVVDFAMDKSRTVSPSSARAFDRLRGAYETLIPSTNAEASSTVLWDSNTALRFNSTANISTRIGWLFQRAPGFMDVVCYTGNGVSGRNIDHNLGVAPELVIIKSRNRVDDWVVRSSAFPSGGVNDIAYLNYDMAASGAGYSYAPTATTFQVGNNNNQNGSTYTYVAYLFASCPGVSKVGSYSGTGGTQTISCGFAARYVLIKRTDSTGDWWVWDTTRGMVAGTDPRLALNSTAADTNNNWVYTDASGFQIVTTDATVNASGGSYIYLAIA